MPAGVGGFISLLLHYSLLPITSFVGAGVPDGPFVGHGRKPKLRRQPFSHAPRASSPYTGEPFASQNCGNVPGCVRRGQRPRRPGLDAVGRRGEHLIRLAALGTFPSRGRQHLIRPCGPPSPQGEGFGGSKPPPYRVAGTPA